jgi:hypothetical protein
MQIKILNHLSDQKRKKNVKLKASDDFGFDHNSDSKFTLTSKTYDVNKLA